MTPKIKKPVGRPPTTRGELPPIGRVLRDVRGELSQTVASAKVRKPLDWWQSRESGKVHVTSDDMELIGKAFDVVWIVADGRTTTFPRAGFALPG